VFCTELRVKKNHGEGEVSAAGDSVVADPSAAGLVSDDGVGLADGVTVSVFFSHAPSRPAVTTKMQMYFFMRRFYLRTTMP
jgi:hypothetical protein